MSNNLYIANYGNVNVTYGDAENVFNNTSMPPNFLSYSDTSTTWDISNFNGTTLPLGSIENHSNLIAYNVYRN